MRLQQGGRRSDGLKLRVLLSIVLPEKISSALASLVGSLAFVSSLMQTVVAICIPTDIIFPVNTAILGTVGYFAYKNWDAPRWDRRVVSAVSVGLLSLWSGEGLVAQHYCRDNQPPYSLVVFTTDISLNVTRRRITNYHGPFMDKSQYTNVHSSGDAAQNVY